MTWLLSPAEGRNPPTEALFCSRFGVDSNWLLIQRGEPEFQRILLQHTGPGEDKDRAVMNAVLANALDPKRPDQATWMKRYEGMRGIPFLWPTEEE